MIRKSSILLILAGSLALFAAAPVSVDQFLVRDNGRLYDMASASAGEVLYTADAITYIDQQMMTLIAGQDGGAFVRMVAVDEQGGFENFLIPLSGQNQTEINLDHLRDKRNLFFLSNEPFEVVIGEGAATMVLEIEARENAREPVQEVEYCSTVDTFTTLTCTSYATCGNIVATDNGKMESCVDFPDEYYKLTWGCHTGTGNLGGFVVTNSSCGCQGFAVWYHTGGSVYSAKSKCPGDTAYSHWSVN